MANQARHSYVQFYPSDWLGGMGFMPPLTEWVYLQICLYNWDKCAAMPECEAAMRLSRHQDWHTDLNALISAGKVHKTHSGGLFVERAMLESQKSFDLWERKSRGGKSSKNQDDGDGRRKSAATVKKDTSKSVDKTDAKSAASNENENENENEITSKDVTNYDPAGDLVFSIPPDIWRDFKQHRTKLKAPMTAHAEKLMLRKLEQLHAQGHDPTAVLEQSIERGWKGVFEIKGGERNGRSNRNGDGFLNACIDG